MSLFADLCYEGMRSGIGPYLALLGASGTAVGVVSGTGEAVGYALRYWSGAALLAQSLRRRNRPRSALAVLAILAVPIAFGEMGSVIKDSLLTACCLAAVGLATHGGRPARLIALALLTVAAATRFNAGFAAAPLLVWLLPARWQDDRWRVAGLILVALALFGASSWLINQEALAPRRTHPMTSLVGFDLAGIVAHGGRPSLLPTSRMSATLVARSRASDDASAVASRDWSNGRISRSGIAGCRSRPPQGGSGR